MNKPAGEGNDGFASLIIGAAAVVGAAGLATLLGAKLAVRLFGEGHLRVHIFEAITSMAALPAHIADPAKAWPARVQENIPGPIPYWFCTLIVWGIFLAGAFGTIHYLTRDKGAGMVRRKRLGVDTRARLAKPKDLAPMIVPGPTSGRFILGRVGRYLVATEDRQYSTPVQMKNFGFKKQQEERRGDRSAVAVLGPTRCGKTANTIAGILDWDGPTILSSVKSDLLEATISWRRQLGDVQVFDPTGTTGEVCARWSPLRAASSVVGAQKAARALCDASPKGGVEGGDFWAALAEETLWPLLWAAAVPGSGRTMSDVVRWVLTQDRPTDEQNLGEVGTIIHGERASIDLNRRQEAEQAWNQMCATWGLDQRTRSSVYATVQTIVRCWADPGVASSSTATDIDLDWLMSGPGARTLYLCAPAHEQQRLSPVFGGLLGDLIQQAFEKAGRGGALQRPLLIVMDEAGNTPCKWLPGVASTCAGIGIQLVTIWQSKSQIDHAYGKLGDSVLTNHGTKIFYSGISDPSTLKYAAELLGEEEVLTRSVNEGSGSKSISLSTSKTSLVPADILRQVAPGQGLLLHGTLPPAHLYSRPYYADKRLAAKARGYAAQGGGAPGSMPPANATGAANNDPFGNAALTRDPFARGNQPPPPNPYVTQADPYAQGPYQADPFSADPYINLSDGVPNVEDLPVDDRPPKSQFPTYPGFSRGF